MTNKAVTIILALGSNVNQEQNINRAMKYLRHTFKDIRFSEMLWNPAIGILSDDFLNVVAVATTHHPLSTVNASLKYIEQQCGRSSNSKEQNLIPLDIDLLLYDNVRFHLSDWERGYIKLLMKQI